MHTVCVIEFLGGKVVLSVAEEKHIGGTPHSSPQQHAEENAGKVSLIIL